jgi:transcriptional regulator with XRE-family HTH domain
MGKFRIRELAQLKGWTQEELSHKSGVRIGTVRRIWQNKGAEDPRAGTLKALAAALEVTIEALYSPDYQGDASSVQLSDNRMGRVAVAA